MTVNPDKRIVNYIYTGAEIFFIIFAFFLMINRIRYGIEFTDESWYIAEPYAVAKMKLVPFVNNVTQTPGATIPLAFVIKIFCSLNDGNEGIVLFSRCFFLSFSLVISMLTYSIVKKFTDLDIPVVSIASLFLASNLGYSLFDLNYHTIGIVYLPLILSMVYAQYEDDTKKSFFWGLCAGVLAVRATMGTVQLIISLTVILMSLILQKKKKRIVGIITGCFLACLIVLGNVIIKHGLQALIIWIKMYLNQSYFLIGGLWNVDSSIDTLKKMFLIAVIMFLMLGVAKLFIRNKYVYDRILISSISVVTICGICRSLMLNEYGGYHASWYTWYIPFLYGLYTTKKKKSNKTLMIVSMAYLSVYLFVSFSTVAGFGKGKAYWISAPLLLTLFTMYSDMRGEQSDKERVLHRVSVYSVLLTVIMFCVLKLWSAYSYVYRDADLEYLTCKIQSGIWKGIYSTEINCNNVSDTEKFLKRETKAEDYILCLDWASFGYLMVNGKICSPSTLDASHYTYRINTPNPYYMYFVANNNVPNIIFYIDYGRDEVVSIDNSEWKFNEFTDKYYEYACDFENDVFAIKKYILVDYEGALNHAKKYARFDN